MKSENGWPLVTSDQLDRSPVPGTNIVPLPGTLGGDVGWILRWVGVQFNNRVQALYNPGCWGWNAPTPIPGSNIYSNHCSGTAVDFNAPSFPWQNFRMTPQQRQACRDIVAETEWVVVWGGDFTTLVDEMHFEISGTPADVARIVKKLKGGEDVIPDRDHLDLIFQRFFLRNSLPAEQEEWIGKKGYTELLDKVTRQPAYFLAVKKQEVGEVAYRDNWEGQIKSGLATIKELQATNPKKVKQEVIDGLEKALETLKK